MELITSSIGHLPFFEKRNYDKHNLEKPIGAAMTDRENSRQEITIIRAYLHAQIREFKNCEERIFSRLNLHYDHEVNRILLRVCRKISSYYRMYIHEDLSREELGYWMRREIMIALRIMAKSERTLSPEQELAIRFRANAIFRYAAPILFPFSDTEELRLYMHSIREVAEEKNLGLSKVSFSCRAWVLQHLYTPEKITSICSELLIGLTDEEILREVVKPEPDLFHKAPLKPEEYRKILAAAENPEKQKRIFAEIAAQTKEVAGLRAAEINARL
ncbi:MAG: hypothetical protein KGI60_02180 [Patescibacteria group bacterium]|nr:hypothetical protein [Patescibacteria group bacterium]